MTEFEKSWKGIFIFVGVTLLFFNTMFSFISLLLILWVMYVHEKGHYYAAQSVGLEVSQISVGVGTFVFKRTKEGSPPLLLRSIPLGSFNIIESADFEETKTYQEKMLVASGGVIANVLTGLFAFFAFLGLWSLGGRGDTNLAATIQQNFEMIQTTGDMSFPTVEVFFLSCLLMFSSLSLLFAAIQLIPLTFFDGAKMFEYTFNHLMSKRSDSWGVMNQGYVTKAWFGVSVIIMALWFIIW